ncbi:MAG: Gfo/Idh/MocA family oxidoreductase [Deltaproteobacteria bacterium]|jgi:predicted dehydrogenase|nr:Gfo/Idh/MocA family oxidoreductase [Deltaproteobacteria bacterium]
MNNTKIGVALIGTGGVANMHAQGFLQNPDVSLIGAYSRTPEKRAAFAQSYGIGTYDSVDALLADEKVHAVAILTPTPTHVDYASAAINTGKHILLEKPVASNTLELQTLIKAANASKVVCMPNHNYIYSPEIQRAHNYIEAGAFGKLSSLWVFYNQKHWPSMGSPGITLWELCIHHVYVLLYLAGRPTRITATGSNIFFDDPKAYDQLSIQVEFDSGLIGHLWGSFAVDDKTSNPWNVMFKVLGTKGGFTNSWNDLQFGEAEQPGWDLAGYRDSFKYSQQRFIECCLNPEILPLSTLQDTLAAYDILNAVAEALEDRKWVNVVYSSGE